MLRSPAWRGALLGAAGMTVYLYARFGLPPLNPWDLGAGVVVVSFGAGLGLGVGLAWARSRRSPRVLRWTVMVLAALSFWILWSFEAERRAVPRMLATADSLDAVVLGRNVLGNLRLYYPDREGRGIAPRKHAHAGFTGDSIRVYVDPAPPHEVLDVWPAGPDLLVTLERLVWLWLFVVALLAGWLPLLVYWLRGPEYWARADS